MPRVKPVGVTRYDCQQLTTVQESQVTTTVEVLQSPNYGVGNRLFLLASMPCVHGNWREQGKNLARGR